MGAISEEQFRHLMSLPKHFVDDSLIELRTPWTREVKSDDEKESFQVDYYKGRAEIRKITVNKRYRTTVVLARLCTLKRHTNPDGSMFEGAHFHLYDEEYGDAIAHPISVLGLDDEFEIIDAFCAFTEYCKIGSLPRIQNLLEA